MQRSKDMFLELRQKEIQKEIEKQRLYERIKHRNNSSYS